MELPTDIVRLIRHQLGYAALDIQKQAGRGAWIITAHEQASYVTLVELPKVFCRSNKDDLTSLLEAVNKFNPLREVVAVFNIEPQLQIISTVKIK